MRKGEKGTTIFFYTLVQKRKSRARRKVSAHDPRRRYC
ncbi:ArdC family protein [Vibrio vulnificus]|nr:ArdC family protein [Vibrio vulnificus]